MSTSALQENLSLNKVIFNKLYSKPGVLKPPGYRKEILRIPQQKLQGGDPACVYLNRSYRKEILRLLYLNRSYRKEILRIPQQKLQEGDPT
jgi:hypothetical protein